jgi:hypothetical protein
MMKKMRRHGLLHWCGAIAAVERRQSRWVERRSACFGASPTQNRGVEMMKGSGSVLQRDWKRGIEVEGEQSSNDEEKDELRKSAGSWE